MAHTLNDDIVRETIEQTFHEFNNFGDIYRNGLLDDRSFYMEMEQVFVRGFWELLNSYHISPDINETNYRQFTDEFHTYCSHDAIEVPDHLPWLFEKNHAFCEASLYDQKLFFYLMKVFHLTPEYFKPIPDDIPRYSLHSIHQYSDAGVYGIDFNCIDDGGLLKDEASAGKQFRLINDQGLKAVLTIKEDRRNSNRSGMDFDEQVFTSENGLSVRKAEFVAEGHIEGYTAEERKGNRDILIRLTDNGTRIYWLAFWQGKEDFIAFSSFPLWQDYLKLTDEKLLIQQQILSPFFNEFKSQMIAPLADD